MPEGVALDLQDCLECANCGLARYWWEWLALPWDVERRCRACPRCGAEWGEPGERPPPPVVQGQLFAPDW